VIDCATEIDDDGWLCIQVCLCHRNIRCVTFDLPPVEPLARQKSAAFGLSDRIQTFQPTVENAGRATGNPP
jgi:hypothetical protein